MPSCWTVLLPLRSSSAWIQTLVNLWITLAASASSFGPPIWRCWNEVSWRTVTLHRRSEKKSHASATHLLSYQVRSFSNNNGDDSSRSVLRHSRGFCLMGSCPTLSVYFTSMNALMSFPALHFMLFHVRVDIDNGYWYHGYWSIVIELF